MYEQMSIFDWMSELRTEPDVGALVTEHGAVIPHIMRPGYIGMKVCFDCSTESHRAYRVGILEKYIRYGEWMRSIIYTGNSQRTLYTHYPGKEIFECLPWEAYPERMRVLRGRK